MSKLIDIEKGQPLWHEPLMENLKMLEQMILAVDGGGSIGQIEEIEKLQVDLKELKQLHESDVENIEDKIAVLSSRIDELNIEIIEENIETINRDIKAIHLDLFKLTQTTDDIKTLADRNAEVITSLSEAQSSQASKIDIIESDILSLQQFVETIDVQGIADKVDGLEGAVGSLSTQLNALSDTVSESNEDMLRSISFLKEEIEDIAQVLDEHTQALQDIQDQITTSIEDLKVELGEDIAEVGQAVEGNKEKINGISEEIVKISSEVDSIVQDVEDIETKVRKSNHIIVASISDLPSITDEDDGIIAFVENPGETYISVRSSWVRTNKNASRQIKWDDILDGPSSSPSEVDNAIEDSHVHGNLSLLEDITLESIHKWNNAISEDGVGEIVDGKLDAITETVLENTESIEGLQVSVLDLQEGSEATAENIKELQSNIDSAKIQVYNNKEEAFELAVQYEIFFIKEEVEPFIKVSDNGIVPLATERALMMVLSAVDSLTDNVVKWVDTVNENAENTNKNFLAIIEQLSEALK